MKDNKDKKIDMDEVVYVNYRCRRCGNVVSRETPRKYLSLRLNKLGVEASNTNLDFHNCPGKIDQKEHVLFDLISWSEEPIAGAEISKEKEM
ncbi:MAG: hypothetical protein IKR19_08775 [Acholeplasmatales bacterium]|nr:hypothetical protein [Acholeplasmatales bacterium]